MMATRAAMQGFGRDSDRRMAGGLGKALGSSSITFQLGQPQSYSFSEELSKTFLNPYGIRAGLRYQGLKSRLSSGCRVGGDGCPPPSLPLFLCCARFSTSQDSSPISYLSPVLLSFDPSPCQPWSHCTRSNTAMMMPDVSGWPKLLWLDTAAGRGRVPSKGRDLGGLGTICLATGYQSSRKLWEKGQGAGVRTWAGQSSRVSLPGCK